MKTAIKLLTVIISGSFFFISCKNKDNPASATVYYQQADQVGRPAINTVFNVSADKDAFNVIAPSAMGAVFQPKFVATLKTLNPGYTTNLLGQDSAALTTLLATDVLNVSTTGTTTFYDGTNLLTGRTLSDDVIDVELTLLFGGTTGASNPSLTSDNVDENDVPFLTTFPYEAAAH